LICKTGGGAKRAIQVLLDHGVKEEKILFLTLIGTATSAQAQHHMHPDGHDSLTRLFLVVCRVRACVTCACAVVPERSGS
jgi:hypothetical protein